MWTWHKLYRGLNVDLHKVVMQGPDITSGSFICYSITEIIYYITSIGTLNNGKNEEFIKFDNPPPGVGGGGRKAKKKCID